MKKELLSIAAMLGTTVLSGMMLARVPERAAADTADNLSVAVPSSCSLSSTGGTFTDTITPAGSSSKTTSTSDITVSCNDANGWSMYAVGFGNNTKGNTNLTSAGGDIIPTTNSGGSYWSMKLAPTEETETSEDVIVSSYQSFTSVPSDYDKVASMDSDTASADGSSISTFYEVYATAIQAPGTYTGAVKYVLVHPNTAIVCGDGMAELDGTCVMTYPTSISFVGKGVESVTFVSTKNYDSQTISNATESVSLIPGVAYLVSAKLKNGWQLDSFATTAGSISSSTDNPTTYIPADQTAATITISSSVICNPGGTAISNIICMQDITSANKASILTSMTEDTQYQLADSRDGKMYWVSKLKDGNIWMTQNLDFDIDSSETYTSADTNLSSNWTPNTSTYTTSTTTWNGSTTTPESYDPGDVCWNGNLNYDGGGTLDTETVACTSSNMNYHIGNYYNWTAAVAMNDSSSYGDEGIVVTQSICPKGWTLPLGGYEETGSGSFVNLLNQYDIGGTQTMWDAPLSFVLGGFWRGSSRSVASLGIYWSSVVGVSYYAYYLYFNSGGGVYPQTSVLRLLGFSVRCVAAP